MTPTELWNIYYRAMKKWLPKVTDKEVREVVEQLMEVSDERWLEEYLKRNQLDTPKGDKQLT